MGREDMFGHIFGIPALHFCQPFYRKHKEVLLYLFFGGTAFFLNIALFALIDVFWGIGALANNAIGWAICVLYQFFTNREWVFGSMAGRKEGILRQMVKFAAGRLFTLLVEEAILAVFITWLHMDAFAVKLTAQVVVIILNYVVSKFFVFNTNADS